MAGSHNYRPQAAGPVLTISVIFEICQPVIVAIDEQVVGLYLQEMSISRTGAIESPRIDTRLLSYYLWAGVGLLLVALVYALFNLPTRYLYLAAGAPLAFIVVVSPRLALYQFVFVLFIEIAVLPTIPIHLTDISALLVISAAGLDFLTRGGWPRRVPPLVTNYLTIVVVLIVCGLLGYWPHLAIRPITRLLLLTTTLIALYRLTARVTVLRLIKLFFLTAVVHSAYVLGLFVKAGGEARIFGFTGVHFDDVTMVALPIGISLYLWSERKLGPYYLCGSLLILAGLVATQSRAPIILSCVTCALVVVFSKRWTSHNFEQDHLGRSLRRRTFALLSIIVLAGGVVLLLRPELLGATLERFERLFSWQPGGTVFYRLMLTKRAMMAFSDNPIFGVGPGGFKHMQEIYQTLHLSPAFEQTRNLSAHNLLTHYLAETGLVGGLAVVALCVNQMRLSWVIWRKRPCPAPAAAVALFAWALILSLSTVLEASWMWGHLSFLAVFFAALVARQYRQTVAASSVPTVPAVPVP